MTREPFRWVPLGSLSMHSPDTDLVALDVLSHKLFVTSCRRPLTPNQIESIWKQTLARDRARLTRVKQVSMLLTFLVHLTVNFVILGFIDTGVLTALVVCTVMGFPLYLLNNVIWKRISKPRIQDNTRLELADRMYAIGVNLEGPCFVVDKQALHLLRPGDEHLMRKNAPDVSAELRERATRERRDRLYPDRPSYGLPAEEDDPDET